MAKYFFDKLEQGAERRQRQKDQNKALLMNLIQLKQQKDIAKQASEDRRYVADKQEDALTKAMKMFKFNKKIQQTEEAKIPIGDPNQVASEITSGQFDDLFVNQKKMLDPLLNPTGEKGMQLNAFIQQAINPERSVADWNKAPTLLNKVINGLMKNNTGLNSEKKLENFDTAMGTLNAYIDVLDKNKPEGANIDETRKLLASLLAFRDKVEEKVLYEKNTSEGQKIIDRRINYPW